MYKIMKDKLKLTGFDTNNWTSRRRGEIPGFEAFDGPSVADFTYRDQGGVLTKAVFDDERSTKWQGHWPTYHIEVKSTSSIPNTPFIMRKDQVLQVRVSCHSIIILVPYSCLLGVHNDTSRFGYNTSGIVCPGESLVSPGR